MLPDSLTSGPKSQFSQNQGPSPILNLIGLNWIFKSNSILLIGFKFDDDP